MNLDELEKQIVAIESNDIMLVSNSIIASIPYLKQDIAYVKTQLDKLG